MRPPAAAVFFAAVATSSAFADDARSFQLVVVKPGDTMWAIANAYLKDPARWDEILKYNRLPTKDPTVALPGMTLRVPIRLIKVQLRAAHLVYSVNRVLSRSKETADWKPARLSMELFQGDALRTLEASKARVKLLDKELLSLEPNSMAVIKPADRDGDLELKAGSVFAGRARVVTASALVTPRTRDTRYAASVEADLTTRVDVYQGAAGVDAQGSSVEVSAGMSTRVRPGLAPEPPGAIVDLPALESRAFEYAAAVKTGGGDAPVPRAAADLPPTPEADADNLRGDLQSLRVGMPILGYRVQASNDKEFKTLLFDRKFDPDERLRPGDAGLAPGAYWWRIAIIDLLGIEGRFAEPRYYTVGIRRAPAKVSEDLRKALTIVAPAEGAYLNGDKVRLIGVLRDDRLRVEVAGKSVRADVDGNFIVTLPLVDGMNEIVITISDGKGSSAQISRRVTRR